MSKPILVLVPGSWHIAELHFQKIIPKLEAKGFPCKSIALPSVGGNPPIKELSPDTEAVRSVVLEESDKGHDVVVLAHSYGGVPASSALEGLSKTERTESGKAGGVVKLIYIAAFLIQPGTSIYDMIGGSSPPLWNVQGDVYLPNDPVDAFYHDLDPKEAEYYASLLKPHAFATITGKATGAAYLQIPSVYVICEDDQAFPPAYQEACVKGAQDAGAQMVTERIHTSHSPFLSRPDETVDIIIRAAENR